jgi:hypothetical protein
MPKKKKPRIYISSPPEYEYKLLNSMAFFLGRPVATQATAALSLYLRQNDDRLLRQCKFYGRKIGLDEYQMLEAIFTKPDWVRAELAKLGEVLPGLHEDEADVYTDGEDEED